MKKQTIVFLHQEGNTLLGRNKKGPWKSLVNGPGGDVMPGERVEIGGLRELEEELGVILMAEEVRLFGELVNLTLGHRVSILRGEVRHVKPVETEAMSPLWSPDNEWPLGEMHPDVRLWYPRYLSGNPFRFTFELTPARAVINQRLEVLYLTP